MAACLRLRSFRRLLRAANSRSRLMVFSPEKPGPSERRKTGFSSLYWPAPKPRRCSGFGRFRCQITQTDFGGTTVTEAAMAERLCGWGFGRFTSQKQATCSHLCSKTPPGCDSTKLGKPTLPCIASIVKKVPIVGFRTSISRQSSELLSEQERCRR